MANAVEGKFSLEPTDVDPWEALESGGASGSGMPSPPPTFDPSTLPMLTEADKVRAHVAWQKAQDDPVTPISALLHGADPRVGDDEWRREVLDSLIKQGKCNGVGEPPPVAAYAPNVATRLVGKTLAGFADMPKQGSALGTDYADPTRSMLDTDEDDRPGRALGLAASFGLGAGGVPKPENTLGMFGGRLAKGADLEALDAARAALISGEPEASSWASHGWFKDVDNQWKHEIDDSKAALHPLLNTSPPKGATYRLGDALQHPDLYAAYPDFADYRLGFGAKGSSYGYMDMDHPQGPTVQLNPTMPETHLSTTLHELQHAVQERENFARGAAVPTMQPKEEAYVAAAVPEYQQLAVKAAQTGLAPAEQARYDQLHALLTQVDAFRSAAYQKYASAAGEVEARNVETRREMTPEERAAHFPWNTADLEPWQQHTSFSVEGGPMSQSAAPPGGWSPAAKKFLENEKSWYEDDFGAGEDINDMLKGGPSHSLPPSHYMAGVLADAKTLHNTGKLTTPTSEAYAAEANPQAATPAVSIDSWKQPALAHLQGEFTKAQDSYNKTLAGALAQMVAGGPNHVIPSTEPHYWKLVDAMDKAQELHTGYAKSVDDELAAMQAKYAARESDINPARLDAALKPVDWGSLGNPSGRAPTPTLARPDAAALGFNPSLPLYKGMEWHHGGEPGSGLGPLGGFADPSAKPSERAVFATHDPTIANLYSYGEDGGYQMLPMYARSRHALEVHWPDVAPSEAYHGPTMSALIDRARERGADALVVHGVEDVGGPQTQYAFMDPAQLRSHVAAFDPAKLGSADLLHARGLSLLPSDDQGRRKRSVIVHLNEEH